MLNFFKMKWLLLLRRHLRLAYGDSSTVLPSETIFILSPSEYWVLRMELPVKTPKEAAKYGPGLFELSGSYRYEAQKVGKNSFLLIAYDPELISKKLNLLPNLSQVEEITFAQWVFADVSNPIALSNNKFLITVEGIVIEIDAAYVQGEFFITLAEALEHPKFFLKTLLRKDLLTSEFTSKTLKTTLTILIILLGNLGVSALQSYQESSQLQKEMERSLNLSKLPETSIERESILTALKAKENKQLYLRYQAKKISDIPIEVTQNDNVPTPITPNASEAGIVLIPGSTENEANRLLIGNTSITAPFMHGTQMQELLYEGDAITLIWNVGDSSVKEKLKNEITKRFKKIRINERDTQLEVRLL